MMPKAKKLIEVVAQREALIAQGRKAQQRNPFRKPWGLQRDRDLWEQAWIVVLRRGANSKDLRKVKGHATKENVEAGTSIAADKEGNDKSDENADDCVLRRPMAED